MSQKNSEITPSRPTTSIEEASQNKVTSLKTEILGQSDQKLKKLTSEMAENPESDLRYSENAESNNHFSFKPILKKL